MKESMWGYAIIVMGVTAMLFIFFFQRVTNIDEQNYNLLQEVTEASIYDAIDIDLYQHDGTVKINKQAFVASFVKRFVMASSLADSYHIKIYDISENPPKVSMSVSSKASTNLTGETITFDLTNRIDAILETPPI